MMLFINSFYSPSDLSSFPKQLSPEDKNKFKQSNFSLGREDADYNTSNRMDVVKKNDGSEKHLPVSPSVAANKMNKSHIQLATHHKSSFPDTTYSETTRLNSSYTAFAHYRPQQDILQKPNHSNFVLGTHKNEMLTESKAKFHNRQVSLRNGDKVNEIMARSINKPVQPNFKLSHWGAEQTFQTTDQSLRQDAHLPSKHNLSHTDTKSSVRNGNQSHFR